MQDILTRHHVQVMGEGDHTLVLAHGFGCDQQIWEAVAEPLAARFRIVLFDLAGCGRAGRCAWQDERHASLDGHAQDLVDILTALDLPPVTLVGHSVSGTIGMLASLVAPERFRQIVAIGPSPRYLNDPPDYLGGFERADILALLDMMERNHFEWAGYLSPITMANSHRPDLAKRLRNSFAAADPGISRAFAEAIFLSDVRDRLAAVQTPTDILYTDQDAIVPGEVIAYLERQICGCRIRRLAASGHYPHMSDPDTVVAGILAAVEFRAPLSLERH